MSLNKDWGRWVKASLMKYFDDNKGALYLHSEAMERKTQEKRSYFEVQINGPDGEEFTTGDWHLFVDVNCLVATAKDSADLYKHDRDFGYISSLLISAIPVYQYGDGDALLGALIRQDGVNTLNFGQLDAEMQVLESSVESRYRLDLIRS